MKIKSEPTQPQVEPTILLHFGRTHLVELPSGELVLRGVLDIELPSPIGEADLVPSISFAA